MGFDENFNNAVSIDREKGEFQSTVTVNSRIQHFGGVAGNMSYNLGSLNIAKFHVFGSVGKDFESLGYKKHIEKFENAELGIDIHENLFTAACYIVNDIKSNQMIIFHGGALDKCKDIDLREKIKNPEDYLYSINSTQSVDAMANFASQLKDLKIPSIFDPGQVTPLFSPDLLLDIIKKSDMLIGNAFEIKQIKDKTKLSEEELLKHLNAIIITKGADGSELLYKEENDKIHRTNILICQPEKIEDATGAGDGYRSGILTGLSLNLNLLNSCRLGSAIASFVVETLGAQTQKFDLQQVKERFLKTYGYLPQELEKL